MPAAQRAGERDAGARDDARRQAWLREMERAQLAGWFAGQRSPEPRTAPPKTSAVPGISSATARAGAQGRAQPQERAAGPAQPVVGRTSVAASGTVVHQQVSGSAGGAPPPGVRAGEGAEHAEPIQVSAPPVATRTIPWVLPQVLPNRCLVGLPDDATAPKTTGSQPMPPDTAASPTHLHMEAGPHGERVWIALRADAQAIEAMRPALVAEVRRALRAQGLALGELVCNGQSLWMAGENPPSATTPTALTTPQPLKEDRHGD